MQHNGVQEQVQEISYKEGTKIEQFDLFCQGRALAMGNVNTKCKGYLTFKFQNVLHQEMLLLNIVNFFAIAMQHNSKKKLIFYCVSLSIYHCRINNGDWENIILLCRYIILMSRIKK